MMVKKRFSGLDELMIVNPGLPNMERELRLGEIFLGEDGTLYRLGDLQEEEAPRQLAEFYLGEDGTLYRLGEVGNLYGHYFLGEDGKLYQVIR